MSSRKSKKSGSQVRRAPQHRLKAGRHREVPPSVAEVVSTQANAGARLAAIGVLGSTTALAAPGMAAAATGGTGPGAPGHNAAATVPLGMSQGAPVPAVNAFAPTIRIVVIGDSYTSGEGANSSTYTTTPPVISPTGDTFPPLIYPQHNSGTSAINQAIAALQAASPGVNIQVSNVAISGASRVSASDPSYPGTYFTQPAQLDAIKNADIIYNGFAGGNDSGAGPNGTPLIWNNFSEWGTTALVAPDSFLPTVWNSLSLPKFVSPSNPDSPGTNLPPRPISSTPSPSSHRARRLSRRAIRCRSTERSRTAGASARRSCRASARTRSATRTSSPSGCPRTPKPPLAARTSPT